MLMCHKATDNSHEQWKDFSMSKNNVKFDWCQSSAFKSIFVLSSKLYSATKKNAISLTLSNWKQKECSDYFLAVVFVFSNAININHVQVIDDMDNFLHHYHRHRHHYFLFWISSRNSFVVFFYSYNENDDNYDFTMSN